ncbi:hypothetical protein RUM43_002517 [Polyplax serrata]|uniref:Uncharacterized protein n=1 Tax=Polyplax serrata TaxID=468196 RepID=A0AAN8S4T8_POLSC
MSLPPSASPRRRKRNKKNAVKNFGSVFDEEGEEEGGKIEGNGGYRGNEEVKENQLNKKFKGETSGRTKVCQNFTHKGFFHSTAIPRTRPLSAATTVLLFSSLPLTHFVIFNFFFGTRERKTQRGFSEKCKGPGLGCVRHTFH